MLTFLHSAVGATLSLMVMVRDTEAKGRPQASTAVHVSNSEPLQLPESTVVNVDRFEVPLIMQFPLSPLLKGLVLAAGNKVPHVIVMSAKAVIVGKAAGLTVITLETDATARPQASFGAVQVSSTVPPHAPGITLKVDGFEVPLMEQPPLRELVKGIVL